jgi:glycosyltransferase involved in cell wall biosynthesis
MEAASTEVKFLGALYERAVVSALRFHARLYLHGHQVGGTNPSLVEALGAGTPVLAHGNPFNRWVAGSAQRFFESEADCARQLDALMNNESTLQGMRTASRTRHSEAFTWKRVLREYEMLFEKWL